MLLSTNNFILGIDRLCCLSTEGKLHFFIVGPREWHVDEVDFTVPSLEASKSSATGDDCTDAIPGMIAGDSPRFGNFLFICSASKYNICFLEDLLVQQPLNSEVLSMLHDLTRFENLVPRFSATVPPCWCEIQQEQQQRRHPQHLHQHGEATQHTRSWRLQPDK
jgi:baculoviral IAP repeat-containing protein 6